jgi:hypothetical protein
MHQLRLEILLPVSDLVDLLYDQLSWGNCQYTINCLLTYRTRVAAVIRLLDKSLEYCKSASVIKI